MEAMIVSNILLWCLLLALAFVVMGLVRQIGVLHGRIAPAGALMVDKGVAVNEPAPQVTAADRHGRPVNFGYAGEKAQLLFFLSPTCPICKSLLPAIKSIAKEQAQRLDVVFVSDGEPAAQQALIAEHKLEGATYVVGPEVGMTYQIGKLPYAALIDRNGILRAKGLVNSREHLDSLFEAEHLGSATLQQYLQAQQPQVHSHEPGHAHSHSAH
ncbi:MULTISPECIES: methylamine dehydrogenase accessory protein MauD [Pseudomonas]|jgi:methylamine dehydrogenase accessory protein MauD|uniref:methylamine dehydrogenase accessory protein MauD n=1 Tax=Pseudomonas TaxID=286 RepID=UPI0002A4195D|nr:MULTISPECIES: methylamine dehydrogenase accessory protein MauD [Pseudomonas]AMO76436.1 Methylamine utilization protein MauD [Pseudomonas citronellolis]KWR80131.1 methylamine utilization protein MauD [Pseudomonas sp. PI1]MBB1609685.1 methylamine dehydrogenase accessory protein MauD [Pseudomonas sp. UMC76]MBB1642303.1 methylamine dehydrogenase accessory protein MauD [Pseudomonas sp. UME83]NTX88858.1 methylamine dehydrogenase accessory protein MauD [Pseudomonas sp. UMA643]